MERKKTVIIIFIVALLLVTGITVAYFAFKAAYPRPYSEIVNDSEVPQSLVYAVAKAESGFRENAVSEAGAIGIMQLMPGTAEFVCRMERITFHYERLKEGEYNMRLGSAYLKYLINKFGNEDTAVAAYNAGEGIVREWLMRNELSDDGITLSKIPFSETNAYVRKVKKFRKNYEILYDKT